MKTANIIIIIIIIIIACDQPGGLSRLSPFRSVPFPSEEEASYFRVFFFRRGTCWLARWSLSLRQSSPPEHRSLEESLPRLERVKSKDSSLQDGWQGSSDSRRRMASSLPWRRRARLGEVHSGRTAIRISHISFALFPAR